jgi:hypothetical protein
MNHKQQKMSDNAHAAAKGRERNSRVYAAVLSDSSAGPGPCGRPAPLIMDAVIGRVVSLLTGLRCCRNSEPPWYGTVCPVV